MQSDPIKRVLIMAGGTGGHVIPGLAVAKYLQNHGIEVHWLGTEHGLEATLVPPAHIPLHFISISGLRRNGIIPLLTAPAKIVKAIHQASKIIRQVNPQVVIGLGGFVSGPGGIASWLQRRPLVIHEQNAIAGFTNNILAKFAERVMEGFPCSFKKQQQAITVGNPVRSEIENLPPPNLRTPSAPGRLKLLILGGSQGAKALNEMLPDVLIKFPEAARPLIYHQTGEKNLSDTLKKYQTVGLNPENFQIVPFISDMVEAYRWADMVICRSGALTVAELCAAGLGAVLVPFPYAVDDHQTANANYMVQKNAAICIQQASLTPDYLATIIQDLSQSPEKRHAMGLAAYELRFPRTVEKIYNICKEVCS